VRLPLENRADAVLVAKGGQLLFANPAAARLFGYETGEDVINDASLERQFGGLGQSLPPTGLACDGGREVRASAQMTVIPWLGGPARQFVLSPAEADAPPPADLKLVPATAEKASAEAGSEPAPEPRATAEVIQLAFRQAPSEADQELRAILDTAADGIITLDQEARIHTFSAGRRRSSAIASPMWRASP
jgi:PAS domain-containing protein